MAERGPRVLEILGGASLLEDRPTPATDSRKGARPAGRQGTKAKGAPASRRATPGPLLEPGALEWTRLVREGLPAESTKRLAEELGLSLVELAKNLRLPARTVHRRLEKREALTPEESERSIRAARVLAKAQEILGDENGRGWVLSSCRGLGAEAPITLLDTSDGFTAVMDELGRLEYGVIG